VITVTKRSSPFQGAVFETADSTSFVVMAAQTRDDADSKAAVRVAGARRCESALPIDDLDPVDALPLVENRDDESKTAGV
jgi:hypothetical protein